MAVTSFAGAQEVLAATLPGYTRRPHQEALAARIEQAIAKGQGGMFQAGCGTGKSLAALIPAVISGERVVVGTATKALQDQYRGDLAFLAENLQDFTWAVLKGRTNYPCLLKIRDLGTPSRGQAQVLASLAQLDDEVIADRESLPGISDPEWSAISMSPSECPGAKHCPLAKQCHAERAKIKAQTSQVVVTNLAYLMTDLLIRSRSENAVQLLGEYSVLVLDEAHNLPDAATSALSDKLGEFGILRLASDVEGFLREMHRDYSVAEYLTNEARVLWQAMTRLFGDRNRGNREPGPVRLSQKDLLGFGEQLTRLAEALTGARDQVVAVKGLDEGDPARVTRIRLMNRLAEWNIRITSVLLGSGQVSWLETEEMKMRGGDREVRLYLHTAPLSPASWLREVIWDSVPALMMSATLATGHDRQGRPDFSYLRELVGLEPGEADEFDAGTPFDFATQAMLYVPPKGTPEPRNGNLVAWQVYTQQATRKLVEAAGGNALLLYTSRRNLNAAWDALSDEFREQGLNVLRQGDAPTPELIRQLKIGRAVLFGLKTFFEGVDVQGEAVSLVIIDKLPFAVPSDVLVQARAEELKRRFGDWADFNRMTIPSMSLVLIQGVGRLVRHASDHGVMAVLDPRLESKGYGKRILGALPPAPKTTDLSRAADYLKAHRG